MAMKPATLAAVTPFFQMLSRRRVSALSAFACCAGATALGGAGFSGGVFGALSVVGIVPLSFLCVAAYTAAFLLWPRPGGYITKSRRRE